METEQLAAAGRQMETEQLAAAGRQMETEQLAAAGSCLSENFLHLSPAASEQTQRQQTGGMSL